MASSLSGEFGDSGAFVFSENPLNSMKIPSCAFKANLRRLLGDDSWDMNKSAIKFNSKAMYRASDSGKNLI